MAQPTNPRISYWLKRNRYASTCALCASPVEADRGWTQKQDDAWQTLCHACVLTHARAFPQLDKGGSPMHAPGLNDAHAGGSIYTCTKCRREVVLIKSAKSGKWFFCEVQGGRTGVRYAATHAPHTAENCAERVAEIEQYAARYEAEQAKQQRQALLQPLFDEAQATFDAEIDAANDDRDLMRAALERHLARIADIHASN